MSDIDKGTDIGAIKYHDNGDGSYAPYVATIGSTDISIGDGANTVEGTTTDAAVAPGSTGTMSGKLRQISNDSSSTAANTGIIGSVEGTVTDVAVAGDSNGTISSKFRGLLKIFASVWDSTFNVLSVRQSPILVPSTTMQSSAAATGAGTALNVTGFAEAILHVTGTFVGTITPQASSDGTNFDAGVSIRQLGSTSGILTTITAAGTYKITTVGLAKIQANITTFTSGTITVVGYEAVQGAPDQLVHVYQDTKIDTNNDAISSYEKGWTPVNLIASGVALTQAGTIKGFLVNSTTSGTVRIADSTISGAGYLGGAITVVAGQFYQYPANVANGCYATITGTVDITVFVRAGTQA